MDRIGWSELLSAGCDALDAEHKLLVSLINECIDLSQADSQDNGIIPAVGGLIVFADQHFANEERIMRQFGYPDTDGHVAAHRHAIRQLHGLGLSTSGGTLCQSVGSYLTHWFFAHASTHDRALGEWLSRECPPSDQWPISSWASGTGLSSARRGIA